MENHLPKPHTPIRTGTRQSSSLARAAADPQDGVHSARARVLQRNVFGRIRHAPNIHVGIERARRTVLRVGGPR